MKIIMRSIKPRTISRIFLFVVVLFLLYFMLLSESMGRTIHWDDYRYNLIPFREISRFINNVEKLGVKTIFVNVFGNIFVFIPLGILLPVAFQGLKKWYKTAVMVLVFSLCIELIQLIFKIGSFDVDDLMLNLFGGIIGYIIYKIFSKIIVSGGSEKNETKKNTSGSKNKVYK